MKQQSSVLLLDEPGRACVESGSREAVDRHPAAWAPPRPGNRPARNSSGRLTGWGRWAWAPLPVLAIGMLILWVANLRVAYSSPVLLVTLNFVFTTLVSLLVAFLAGRTFLFSGQPGLLSLGCGMLIWGLASVAGPAVFHDSINGIITVHNLGVWFSAFCQLAGAMLALRTVSVRSPALWLAAAYSLVVGAVGLIFLLVVQGQIPLFFIQGQGGTPLRQFVLSTAVGMLVLTTVVIGAAHRNAPSRFLYWYALGIGLLAAGLAGVMAEPAFDGPLSWAGRATQFLGGIYILMAALAAMREAGGWAIPLAEALRQARRESDFLGQVLEHAAQPFAVGYPDGRIGRVNRAFEELTGYTAGELRGIDWSTLLTPPEWREMERERLEELNRTGQPVRYQKEYIRKDGTRVPIELLVHLVRDAGGRSDYYYSFLTDITERKRAEAALLESQGLLRAVMEGTPDPVYVKDRDGRLLLANPALARVAGKPLESILGKTDAEYYGDPAVGRTLREHDLAVIAHNSCELLEETVPTPLGPRTFLSSKAPYCNPAGEIIGVIGISRDITERKHAEERLHELTQRLSYHVDNSPLAVIEWGPDHRLTRWSGEAERLFGWKAEEVLGKRMDEFRWVYVEDQDKVADVSEDLRSGRNVRRFSSNRNYRKDGSILYCEWYNSSLVDASGKLRSILSLVLDVTDRKQAEDRNRQQSAMLEGINCILKGALTCDTEEELGRTCLDVAEDLTQSSFGFLGRIDPETGLMNGIAVSNPGWEACRVLDQSPHSRKPPLQFKLHGIYGRVLLDGKGFFTNDPSSHPDRVGLPSGHPTLQSFLGVPLIQDGKTIGMVGLANREGGYSERELRAAETIAIAVVQSLIRRESDTALRRTAERLELLSEVSSRLLASPQPQELIEDLCRRALVHLDCHAFFNFMVDEAAGKLQLNACAGIPEEDIEKIRWLDYGAAVCGCAARDGFRIVSEHIPSTSDPRTDLVKSYGIKAYACHPLLGPREKVLGTLSFGTRTRETFSEDDLSLMKAVADQVAVALTRVQGEKELREAKEKAEEANSSKDKFLAVLSHELRTPLSPVLMTASALELDDSLPAELREDMALIRRSVELEVRLINDLLDFNRVKWSKLNLDLRTFDAHEKLRAAVEICRPEAFDKQITVSCALEAASSWVSADAARLQQVFWNLLKNAIKFTPQRGRIEIRSSNPLDGWLRIEFADDGIGIAPEALSHVFEPFVQASGHVTRQFGGLGLGLAISKSLVELHGGTIRAESAGRGQGTTFIIELPLVAVREDEPVEEPLSAGDVRSLRILFVEDHETTADVTSKLLTRMGHQVSVAGSVADALQQLGTQEFDLLISDLGLPDGSGHDLMRRAREIRPALRGFAVSGYGTDGDVRQSREAGFLEHLTKPVGLPALKAAIGRLIGT